MNFSLSGRSGRELPLALFTFESAPYVLANDRVLALRDGERQPQCRIAYYYEFTWVIREFYPVEIWPE